MMLELLNFVFYSFWTFTGSAILLSIAIVPFTAFMAGLGVTLRRR